MKESALLLAALMIAAVGAYIFQNSNLRFSFSNERPVDDIVADLKKLAACEKRGVAYYKEIGSYPSLSDGRSADVKIGQVCRFNSNNF